MRRWRNWWVGLISGIALVTMIEPFFALVVLGFSPITSPDSVIGRAPRWVIPALASAGVASWVGWMMVCMVLLHENTGLKTRLRMRGDPCQ